MLSIDQIRQLIADAYPASKTWQARVEKMSDNQVLAVYRNFKKKGIIFCEVSA